MEDTTQHRDYVSWQAVEALVDQICKEVSASDIEITSVTGLPRGGMIPAVMISHRLSVPYTQTIKTGTLIVDDICDSGETLKAMPSGIATAVLHYKATASVQPTFYAKEVGESWIVYPWEAEDSQAIQDYLK